MFGAILGDLLKGVLSWVTESITAWYNAEKSAANEWEAKSRAAQMESLRVGKEWEKGVTEAANAALKNAVDPTKPAPSTEDINSLLSRRLGVMVALGTFCLASSGCFRFYVTAKTYTPVIKVEPAPTITPEDAPEQRERKLVGRIVQLTTAIEEHNKRAREQNASAGYPGD